MSTRAWLLVGLVACGGGSGADADGGGAVVKPWVKTAQTADALNEANLARESMRFVTDGGSVTMTFAVDRRPVVATMGVEQVALRIGDVPTLDLPLGYVKLDTMTFSSGDELRDKFVQALALRDLGAPIHVVFDPSSVGGVVGRLTEPGSEARGEVVGTLQIGTRQEAIGLPARFTRTTPEKLTIDLGPFDLNLGDFAMEPALDAVAAAIGARHIAREVTIAGRIQLVAFLDDGAQLPGFVRTPVTVETVTEIKERLDRDVDDVDALKMRLRAAGLSDAALKGITTESLEKMNRILAAGLAQRDGQRGVSVLDNPAETEPRSGGPSGERVEGGVTIRD